MAHDATFVAGIRQVRDDVLGLICDGNMLRSAVAQNCRILASTKSSCCAPSLIPGFKTVSMRDVIMQPGSKTMGPPMENAMVCHITEGELQIEQDGKTFTAKKNIVWTCNKDTKEQASNVSSVVAIMRITDLKA